MLFAAGACSNAFTSQQVARMHCYADMKYKNWMETSTPTTYHIPLAPRIIPLGDPQRPTSIAIVSILYSSIR